MNQDVQAVIRSQEYFRLKQVVQSPGDIYELDESTRAVYIGPDSDIGEVQMTYFNPDEPNALETAIISINGPFVGRVDALLKTIVPSTSQPARILINPVDIVDNAYVPPLSIAERRFNIPAQIDLIAALKNLPDIPSVRADKTFRFPSVPYTAGQAFPPDNGSTDILLPIYGRRFVTATFLSPFDVRINFFLVTLQPGKNPVPRGIGFLTISSTIPPSDFTVAAVIRANDAGRQGRNFTNAGVFDGFYAESDQPEDPLFALSASPRSRGLADLLYINIEDTSGVPVPELRFIDMFVKVSDRES